MKKLIIILIALLLPVVSCKKTVEPEQKALEINVRDREAVENKQAQVTEETKKAAEQKKSEEARPVICKYCGLLNSAGLYTCKGCGAPLIKK